MSSMDTDQGTPDTVADLLLSLVLYAVYVGEPSGYPPKNNRDSLSSTWSCKRSQFEASRLLNCPEVKYRCASREARRNI